MKRICASPDCSNEFDISTRGHGNRRYCDKCMGLDLSAVGAISPQLKKRVYARKYYQNHKRRARQYQQDYNRKFKKKDGGIKIEHDRPAVKVAYTPSDLMHLSPEKADRAIAQIMSGRKLYTIGNKNQSKEKEGFRS